MRIFLSDLYDNLVLFFSDWQETVLPFKIFSAIVSLFLLFLVIILFRRVSEMMKLPVVPTVETPPSIDKVTGSWEKILSLFEKGDDANLKIAVIEADKLVGDILERAGFPGQDMGERLMGIDQSQLKSINDLWRAHKVRNRIAHEADYRLASAEAEEAINGFRKALEDLGVL